ncbi:hypothetical protein GCM10027275_14440 [Rhabdobacter roseus]|uniref:Uncharacterized protein n=1 Tax=Rhabdobacter roseus TaxID=1655419 RepID=A0A840TQ48_9BACT|nr:hypothetical protein [Rhabdobacter roseus]MBB5283363.1 hypothetical protein [Rhabdobacter roseus]
MTQRALTLLVGLTLLLPLVIYFWVWNYYAVNVPKWDDHALKAFLVEYLQAPNWQAKWAALFRQHNEHRIVLTRLLAWWDYALMGSLNFRHLMLAGNLLLVGVIGLWWVLLHRNQKPFYTLLPVPFLWLTLAHWENMYWGMSAVQNFGVVSLLVWTLYLVVSRRLVFFLLALPLAGLTLLTSGNGLLVLPIGALLLLLSKEGKRLVAWLVTSGLYAYLYFSTYQKPAYNPESKATFGALLKGYMAFLGSFAEAFPVKDHLGWSVGLGTVLFLVALSIALTTAFRLLRNRYDQDFSRATDLFCLGTLLFILGTAVIVVNGRAGFGLEVLLTSRYKPYSFLLLLIAYLYIVIPIRGSFLSPYVSGIVLLNAMYSVFSYHYHLVDAFNFRKFQTTNQFNWTYPDKELKPQTDTSLAGNLVAKTPLLYDQWVPLLRAAHRQSFAGNTNGMLQLWESTTFTPQKDALLVSQSTFNSQRLQDSGVYVVLSSRQRYYIYPTYRRRNTNRKQLFLHQQYFAPGYQVEIPHSELEPGRYAVGLAWQQGSRTGVYFSKDSITSVATPQKSIRTNW